MEKGGLKKAKFKVVAAAIASMKAKGKLWPKNKKGIRKKGLASQKTFKKISLVDRKLSGDIESSRGNKFSIKKKGEVLEITDKRGRLLKRDSKTKREAEAAYAKKIQRLERAGDTKLAYAKLAHGRRYLENVANQSASPSEIKTAYKQAKASEKESYADKVIRENIGRIRADEYDRYGDKNNRQGEKGMMLRSFAKGKNKSLPIDIQAQEMSRIAGREITPNDIVSFISRKGKPDSSLSDALAARYKKVTGLDVTKKYLKKKKKKNLDKPWLLPESDPDYAPF